jgi:O-antigen/teichoic acid export membrane protein
MGTVCATMQVPAVNLLFGTSNHAFYAKINWFEAALVLVLKFTWGNSHGLLGIAYAYAVSMIIVKLGFQPWGAARVLGLSLLRYHYNTVPSALKALAFTLPMVWLLEPYVVPKYSVIFLGTAVCAALFAVYVYWVGFNAADRTKLRNAVYKRKRKQK